MSKWKELKIDNLPPDILTGDYEFEYVLKDHPDSRFPVTNKAIKRYELLKIALVGDYRYYYSKPEPKAPSHEEIMTKWFLNDSGIWEIVSAYCPLNPLMGNMKDKYHVLASWVSKAWFTGRESADIPPEAE